MLGAGSVSFSGKFSIFVVKLGRGRVSFVDDNKVVKGRGLARVDRKIAGMSFELRVEIMVAKRIGGHEAVLADVPGGGMTRIGRAVENRNAVRLAANRA